MAGAKAVSCACAGLLLLGCDRLMISAADRTLRESDLIVAEVTVDIGAEVFRGHAWFRRSGDGGQFCLKNESGVRCDGDYPASTASVNEFEFACTDGRTGLVTSRRELRRASNLIWPVDTRVVTAVATGVARFSEPMAAEAEPDCP